MASSVNPVEGAKARTAFDTAAGSAGLILLSPFLLLTGIAILVDDGWPVFFRQQRVGRGGRLFQLFKFRSMRRRLPGRSITAGDDPRLTRVGRILRKYKVDEFPQLWNVVKGEMSLVGPRPEIPPFVNIDDPVWRAVLQFRPGITDLASLVYRNEEEILGSSSDPEGYYRETVLPAKLALNLRYAQARSFRRDMKLIWLTVRYSFFPSRFKPSSILDAFPVSEPEGLQPQER